MRKEDISSLVVYAIMIVIALFVGLKVIAPSFQLTHIVGAGQYLFALGSIFAGFFINVVMLEVGHIVGAKVGGYEVLSVNFLGLCFYKFQSKWKVAWRSFDGLTGETKIAPKKEKPSPYPFFWFGLILFVLEFALGLVIYALLPEDNWLKYSVIIVVAIGGMLMLYNVIPLKLDSMNDGYRLALISKGVNVAAFNELMRIDRLMSEGKKIEDIITFDEITTLTAQVNLYRIYELLSQQEYEQAEQLLDKIIEQPEKLNEVTNGRVYSQKLYVKLMTLSQEDAVVFYNNEAKPKQKRFVASDLSMESLRAYLLVAGLVEESESEVVYVLERKNNALKRAKDDARKDAELELFNRAFDKIKQAHPDWEFKS